LHRILELWFRKIAASAASLLVLFVCEPSVAAQTWTWKTQMIDVSGTMSSLALDAFGNLHVSYYFAVDGELRYAFRPAGGDRWFKSAIDHGYGEFSTRIAVDAKADPYICYSPGTLKFASFHAGRWTVQPIDPGGGLVSYTCSVQVGRDGIPQVLWYVESGVFLRYARLKDGVWEAQTADQDSKPGKWNSMVLNSKGLPRLSYVTIFKWELRYAEYDGKAWIRRVVDSPALNPPDISRGMGNSLALDAHDDPLISYYDTQSLKIARLVNNRWKIEVVDRYSSSGEMAAWKTYRSSLVLDKQGNPHIAFVTPSGLEHAWSEGKEWHTQLVVGGAGAITFDSSMVIGTDGRLYITYVDPSDHTLKLATGLAMPEAQSAKAVQTDNEKPRN